MAEPTERGLDATSGNAATTIIERVHGIFSVQAGAGSASIRRVRRQRRQRKNSQSVTIAIAETVMPVIAATGIEGAGAELDAGPDAVPALTMTLHRQSRLSTRART